MPELTPEQKDDIRELANVPDEFYRMYEASGNIVMIKGINLARWWVAHLDQSPQTKQCVPQHKEMSDCSVQ
ncbi:MAG: hypothetical protein JRC86_13445 [Deltaproteobacteria bacterium]|nr:hypothetical protein [Deltaproteobacteria bacterium]